MQKSLILGGGVLVLAFCGILLFMQSQPLSSSRASPIDTTVASNSGSSKSASIDKGTNAGAIASVVAEATARRAKAGAAIGGSLVTSAGRPLQEKSIAQGWAGPSKPSEWWLYARNVDDANWLERQGFPTPSQETLLQNASLDQLLSMASAGNDAAKVHLAIKQAQEGLNKRDPKAVLLAGRALEEHLFENPAYAASKALHSSINVFRAMQDIPDNEATKELKQAYVRYQTSLALAEGLAATFGDYTASYSNHVRVQTQNPNATPHLAHDLGGALAAISERRLERGLPPLTVDPRPRLGLRENARTIDKVLERK